MRFLHDRRAPLTVVGLGVAGALAVVVALHTYTLQPHARAGCALWGVRGCTRGGLASGPPLGPEDCTATATLDLRFSDPRLAKLARFINGSQVVLGGLCASFFSDLGEACALNGGTAFRKAADLGPLGRRCLLHDRARGCLTRSHMLRTWSAAHPGKPIMAADGSFEGRALRWNDAPQGFYFAAGAAGSAPALEASLAFSRARPIPLRSMSKALTAAVMLALQDRGLLSINDPVAKHLPALGAPPPGAAPATLRNLLTHTAGLPEYRVDVENHGPPALTLANISLAAAAGEIVAIWGSQVRASPFLYTALAYQLLGAVAEAAAGKSWHALFAELVARPLRMRDTRFYHYFSTESGVPNPHLAVGAVGTPADMELFVRMLLNKGVGAGGARVLSEAAVHDMMQPHALAQGIVLHRERVTLKAQCLESAGELLPSMRERAASLADGFSYGLGMYVGANTSGGPRNAMLVGRLDTQAVLMDVGGAAPHYAHGYSFSPFRGTWSLPAAIYAAALEEAPPGAR